MVGYKEPPVHSRFKAGVSGNPKGRPRSKLSLARELSEELAELVNVGGKPVTKLRAIVNSLVLKALTGDLRTATALLGLCGRALSLDQPADDDIDPADRAIAEASEKRERRRAETQAPDATQRSED